MTVSYAADMTPGRRQPSSDIWLVSSDGKEKPRPWLETPFRETGATVSPNGRWVAYASDESGTFRVYVRPLSGAGAAVQVSTGPGTEPAWSRNGGEIVYRTGEGDRDFVAVAVRENGGLSVSPPRPFFTADWEAGGLNHEFREWDVSRDGAEVIGLRAVRTDEPDRRIEIATNSAAP
jgi:hypothetical protein